MTAEVPFETVAVVVDNRKAMRALVSAAVRNMVAL